MPNRIFAQAQLGPAQVDETYQNVELLPPLGKVDLVVEGVWVANVDERQVLEDQAHIWDARGPVNNNKENIDNENNNKSHENNNNNNKTITITIKIITIAMKIITKETITITM